MDCLVNKNFQVLITMQPRRSDRVKKLKNQVNSREYDIRVPKMTIKK